jgi:hypothetical protein
VLPTLDRCGSMEIFSYMTNLLDQFLLKDKSHFFVYEYEKFLLLPVIKKLCVMHAMCQFFFFLVLNLSIQGNEGKFHDAREENNLYHFRNVFWIMEVTTLQTCIFQRH